MLASMILVVVQVSIMSSGRAEALLPSCFIRCVALREPLANIENCTRIEVSLEFLDLSTKVSIIFVSVLLIPRLGRYPEKMQICGLTDMKIDKERERKLLRRVEIEKSKSDESAFAKI